MRQYPNIKISYSYTFGDDLSELHKNKSLLFNNPLIDEKKAVC